MFRQLFSKALVSARLFHLSNVERTLSFKLIVPSSTLGRSLHQMSRAQFPLLFNVVQARSVDVQAKRSKKKFSKNKKAAASNEEDENDDDDDDEDDDEDLDEGDVIQTTSVNTRLDVIGKECFKIARAKFDDYFFKSMVRVNGERASKKSTEVFTGDEIDLIKGFNADNPQLLDVTRVQILKIDDKASSNGRIRISYKKNTKLVIKNYERDPFESSD